MSDYQRITSYLYEYTNGIRRENIGFARIEVWEEKLKISFSLDTDKRLPSATLYFYYYDHGKIRGIPWDEKKELPPRCQYKESFYTKEIFPEPLTLSHMSGLLFYHNDSHFYGSQWDDQDLNLRLFERPDASPPQLEEYMEALSLHEQILPEAVEETEAPACPEIPDDSSLWDSYPSVTPLPNPDFSHWIRLKPEDLLHFSLLPPALSGNGFLKMQAQDYGHVMLGRKKLTDCYYVGIPGIFSNQRNFVAHLFGFPDFITVPHEKQKTGHFGYWLMTVDR